MFRIILPVGRQVQNAAGLYFAGQQLHEGGLHHPALVMPLLGPGVGKIDPHPVERGVFNALLQQFDGVFAGNPDVLQAVLLDFQQQAAHARAVEVRGLTIKIEKIPIPVPFGAGFEGERVRKEDMYCQFGGKYTDGFEHLKMLAMDDVEDGKIEVIGPEIDALLGEMLADVESHTDAA